MLAPLTPVVLIFVFFSFFFFQAEDGIRDFHVTGVQTCALPISPAPASLTSTCYRATWETRPHRPTSSLQLTSRRPKTPRATTRPAARSPTTPDRKSVV